MGTELPAQSVATAKQDCVLRDALHAAVDGPHRKTCHDTCSRTGIHSGTLAGRGESVNTTVLTLVTRVVTLTCSDDTSLYYNLLYCVPFLTQQ